MITITPAANTELTRILAQRSGNKLYLSLGERENNCEQFYYQLEAIAEPAPADMVVTVNGLTLVLDQRYQQYLQNLQIDFAQDLMGGGFRFQNPAAAKVCPCGNAFTAHTDGHQTDPTAFEI